MFSRGKTEFERKGICDSRNIIRRRKKVAGTKEFEEWTGGASESEIVKIEKIVKKTL